MNDPSRASGDRLMNSLLVILVALALLGGAGLYMFRKHQLAMAVERAHQAERVRVEAQRRHKQQQQQALEETESGSALK